MATPIGIKSAQVDSKSQTVTVVFDLSLVKLHHDSSTGVSTILASTSGSYNLGDGLVLTASVYRPKPKNERPKSK
jgi:hypothetical protein